MGLGLVRLSFRDRVRVQGIGFRVQEYGEYEVLLGLRVVGFRVHN